MACSFRRIRDRGTSLGVGTSRLPHERAARLPSRPGESSAILSLARFLVLAIASGAIGCGGEATPAKTTPTQRSADVAVTVIDERTDRWFSQSRLYLKAESSLEPGVALLLPINVSRFDGETRRSFRTPFALHPDRDETIVLEWLDDQSMTDAKRNAILSVWEAGGWVAAVGGQILLVRRSDPLVATSLSATARQVGEVLTPEPGIQQFKSFGRAEYHVPREPAESYRAANPIVLVHDKSAKAEVRFFYPRASSSP
jgi:hypothetical protein